MIFRAACSFLCLSCLVQASVHLAFFAFLLLFAVLCGIFGEFLVGPSSGVAALISYLQSSFARLRSLRAEAGVATSCDDDLRGQTQLRHSPLSAIYAPELMWLTSGTEFPHPWGTLDVLAGILPIRGRRGNPADLWPPRLRCRRPLQMENV